MQAKLIVVEPNLHPNEYRIDLPSIIGRGGESQLTLDHSLISRHHCELYEENGQVMVRDLGSRNGTFISGQRVENAPLPSGELLTVGGITFRAFYGNEAMLARSQNESEIEAAGIETVAIDETAPVSVRPTERPSDYSHKLN
jgi:pSer/pThr/pTyr-binding forkhead associated (FHA) protein